MTTKLTATAIVEDKFWVVEQQGEKVATIQAVDEGGFAFVANETREYFPSIRDIKQKYNIKVSKKIPRKVTVKKSKEIYGFPCHKEPHSEVFNIQKHLPIYSLDDKSKSFYCAGYYMVKYGETWVTEFCPKLIVLNRYRYIGPYATKEELIKASISIGTNK